MCLIKKRICSIFILLSINFCAYSQAKTVIVFLPYNTSDIGWYGYLGVSKKIGKTYSLLGGITYHYNQQLNPDRNTDLYFRKRFRAEKSTEHFGGQLAIQKNICKIGSGENRLYAFYELSVRNISCRSLRREDAFVYSDTTVLPNGQLIVEGPYRVIKEYYVIMNNLWSLENIIGVGASFKIKGNFNLVTNIGGGTNIIMNVPSYISSNKITAEYSLKFNVGFSYDIR